MAGTGGDGTIVYEDGRPEGVADALRSVTFDVPSGNLVLGRRFVDLDGFYSSLTIDEITIFDVALSAADVEMIYQMSTPPT